MLGILKTFDKNQVFLTKLVWRAKMEKEATWAKLCRARSSFKSCKNTILGKCLARGELFTNLGAVKIIHSGRNTNLWFDTWLACGFLRSLI